MGYGLTLNDKLTVENMRKARRYPIPESLLRLPQNFELYIDSLIKDAFNRDPEEEEQWNIQSIDAPANSQ